MLFEEYVSILYYQNYEINSNDERGYFITIFHCVAAMANTREKKIK